MCHVAIFCLLTYPWFSLLRSSVQPTYTTLCVDVHIIYSASYYVQVQLEVKVWFAQDQLKGDDTTEIRVQLIKKLEDAVPAGED